MCVCVSVRERVCVSPFLRFGCLREREAQKQHEEKKKNPSTIHLYLLRSSQPTTMERNVEQIFSSPNTPTHNNPFFSKHSTMARLFTTVGVCESFKVQQKKSSKKKAKRKTCLLFPGTSGMLSHSYSGPNSLLGLD